jgi:hypothetical protein
MNGSRGHTSNLRSGADEILPERAALHAIKDHVRVLPFLLGANQPKKRKEAH